MNHKTTEILYYCPKCGKRLHIDPCFTSGAVYFMCDDCGFTQEINEAQRLKLSADLNTPLLNFSEESE